ncbi:hypothetical protein BJ165DRAFT_844765 [Panaeolus papilionaceus]|nr:hypothetical protein BJ165DRAFT_844765 [Panaeolus papilionaceus]
MSVQRPAAQCLSNSKFDWTFNSADQSPCDVAAGLQGVCSTEVIIPPLQNGQTYPGPAELLTTSCICSSVYYSMLSACAFCQGRQWLNWSTYNVYCTTLYVQIFPSPLPMNLSVPIWAYLNVAVRDTFDPTLAQNQATCLIRQHCQHPHRPRNLHQTFRYPPFQRQRQSHLQKH